jgi:N-acetylglucosaminyldiphosphoundecaprenol N-acetyl-beta-D-mannosaminyltransferase
MKRVLIAQVGVDPFNMAEVVERINALLSQPGTHAAHVVTVNAQFIHISRSDRRFADILRRADLSIADGASLIWASRLLGHALPERVAGIDLLMRVCESAALTGATVYFLGGRPGAAEQAVHQIQKICPSLRVAGIDCPPYGFSENVSLDAQVSERIRMAGPDILFAGLGAPKQEYWIERHLHLPVKMMMGVGGSFDLIAGITKRAPRLLQTCGCEWLWRLCMEPRRLWKRYLVGNLVFVSLVVRQCLAQLFGRTPESPKVRLGADQIVE